MSRPDPEPRKPSPYAVALEDLVAGARVPDTDQIAVQEVEPGSGSEWAWDEDRRQNILGGGA